MLARLGLFPLASRLPGFDGPSRAGAAIARIALQSGEEEDKARLRDLDPALRLFAARQLAPTDAVLALELLPANAIEFRAACHIALGDTQSAASMLDELPANRERYALEAHIRIAKKEFAAARQAINALFAYDGLSAPLTEYPDPYSIDDFASKAEARSEGPLISVIVPYRNAAETIETAVRSLCRQTWQTVEILAVDDRSEDEGPAIVRRLADADARIVPIENRRNAGVYGARNTGVDSAKGEYIAFLDADDWSPPERLSRQFEQLRSAPVALCQHIRMGDDGRPVAPRVFPLVRPVPITMMARAEIFETIGPFDEVPTGADSEMLGRLEARFGKRAVARDPAVLLVARWRAGSISRSDEGGMLGRRRFEYRTRWMFRQSGLDQPPSLSDDDNAA